MDININHDRDYFVYGPVGDFHFASLTDLAAGAFEYDLQSFGQSTALFTVPTYSLFAQDQFRATGISGQFVFLTGPGFGNNSPLVTYSNALTPPPASGAGGQSIHVFVPNFRNPYVEQANLTVEHRFGSSTALSVGYVYAHGLALLGNSNGITRQANGNFGYDLNLVPPDQQLAFGGNFTQATVNLPNGKSYVTPEFEAIDRFINPNFSAINAVDNSGKSIYHAMLISLRHQSAQFQGAVAYTLSTTIDQGTGYMNQFDQSRNAARPNSINHSAWS